jgi:hypothetical protein
MTYLWILFTVLQVASLGFAFLLLKRLYYYIKRYKFDETKYTLFLGFIHLRWIMMTYMISVLILIVASYGIFIRI